MVENMTKYGKVNRLPIVEGKLTKEKIASLNLERFGLQPVNLDYRKEWLKGRGASTKDATWNRQKRIHTCCKSKVPWRHKANCWRLKEDQNEGNDKWKALS